MFLKLPSASYQAHLSSSEVSPMEQHEDASCVKSGAGFCLPQQCDMDKMYLTNDLMDKGAGNQPASQTEF
jgi:hypothetical protein